jgi:hypothetical protein
MPHTRSMHGRRSTPRVATVGGPVGKFVAYCEAPYEILGSHDIKGAVLLLAPLCSRSLSTADISIPDQPPDHFDCIERMSAEPPSDDEVDPELERQQVELEALRDMYRGDSIDHCTYEGRLVPREECITRWEYTSDDSNSSEGEEKYTGRSDKFNINAAEGDVIVEVADEIDEDGLDAIGEPDQVISTDSADPAVLAAKPPEEFINVGHTAAFLELEDSSDLGWQSEDVEDDTTDTRHVFGHNHMLVDGTYLPLSKYEPADDSLRAHDCFHVRLALVKKRQVELAKLICY